MLFDKVIYFIMNGVRRVYDILVCVFELSVWVWSCNVYFGRVGSEAMFSNNVVVQSVSGGCISRCSQVSNFGPNVMMSANSNLGGEWCWFWCMYCDKCGKSMVVSWCFGWLIFMVGENFVARC